MLMRWLRQIPRVVHVVVTVAMYGQLLLLFGLTFSVGIIAYQFVATWCQSWPWCPAAVAMGAAASAASLVMVWTLGLLVVLIVQALRLRVAAGRYPAVSWPAIRWATFNFYVVMYRYTLMNFIRATPLHPWFYRLLGARMGRGVQINSNIVADCNLLTIGDYTVIGGEATVICHSYERGYLVIRPVTIGHRVDIGLNAVILPGVTIGDRAIVAAGAVVLKDTHIPAGTLWAGVPARQVRDAVSTDHGL